MKGAEMTQDQFNHSQDSEQKDNDDNLINLNAVWTLVVILLGILGAVYLAYIGNQVEFL
ncbi:MAG: hypothetical protein OQK04_08695 [Kangiellaceae bacterium]|nr:hypothetical protein [Kangiellaceae bacterium]MCW8998776.1 hypothetical protein [Kangiellaceae bacterium]